jgi:ABC-type nitrate/sulfonate/bicarbonate transport system substrate-binding protein
MLRRGFLAGCLSTILPARHARASNQFRVAAFPTTSSAVPMFASASGLFARHGLNVTIDVVEPGRDPRELFRENFDIIAGIHLFVAAPLAMNESIRAKFFLFHAYNEEHFFESLVVHPEAGIAHMRDLAGRRVLVAQGAGHTQIVRELLRQSGVPNPTSVELIVAPQHGFLEVLRARQADAAFTLEPWGTHLETFHGFPTVSRGLLSHYLFGDGEGLSFFGGVIARQSTLQRQLPAIARLREAWEEAYRLMSTDLDIRRQAVGLVFPDIRIARSVGIPAVVAAREVSGANLQQIQLALDMGGRLGFLTRGVDVTLLAVHV